MVVVARGVVTILGYRRMNVKWLKMQKGGEARIFWHFGGAASETRTTCKQDVSNTKDRTGRVTLFRMCETFSKILSVIRKPQNSPGVKNKSIAILYLLYYRALRNLGAASQTEIRILRILIKVSVRFLSPLFIVFKNFSKSKIFISVMDALFPVKK